MIESVFPIPGLCHRHELMFSAMGAAITHSVALRGMLLSVVANDPAVMERCGFDPAGDAESARRALERCRGIIAELAPLCCYVGDPIYEQLATRALATDGTRPRG